MYIPRNQPCPCGSGKRFKHCHGELALEGIKLASVRPGVAPPEVFRKAAAEFKKGQERARHLGDIGLPNTVEFNGKRMVGVGGSIFAIDPNYAPLNLAAELLVKTFGQRWFEKRLKKPAQVPHPVVEWYRSTMALLQRSTNEGGDVELALTGPAKAWFLLAWDIWVLQHHELLAQLVPKLRNSRQFQGARYELTTYALFVRAGFKIEPENEADGSQKHVEYIATHLKTGERVAVEAKIRHRPGVLGFRGTASSDDAQPGITDRLRDAFKKRPGLPYVICIDLNLPPTSDEASAARIIDTAHAEVEAQSKERERNGRPFPATMVIITNYAHHYGDPHQPDPESLQCVIKMGQPAHAFTRSETVDQILEALASYGNLPRGWEDFER